MSDHRTDDASASKSNEELHDESIIQSLPTRINQRATTPPPSGRGESNQISGRGSSHRRAFILGHLHFPDKHDKTIVWACQTPCNHGNLSRPVNNSTISWAATQHMLNTRNESCTQSQWRVLLEQNDMGHRISDKGRIPRTVRPTHWRRTGSQRRVQTSTTGYSVAVSRNPRNRACGIAHHAADQTGDLFQG